MSDEEDPILTELKKMQGEAPDRIKLNTAPPAIKDTAQPTFSNNAKISTENKRFCTYCGTELKQGINNSFFCPKCGYKPAESGQTSNNSSKEKKEEDGEWTKRDKINLAFKVAVYIIVGFMVIYLTKVIVEVFEDLA